MMENKIDKANRVANKLISVSVCLTLCTAVLGSLLIIGVARVWAADTTTGLIAYYPFNGNANDASGNGNNGTVNGATLTTDRFGNANSAYSFNGSTNYISVADAPILNLGTNEFTIFSWIKSQNTGYAERIVTKRQPYSTTWYSLFLNNGKAAFEITPTNVFFSTSMVSNGDWHLLTVTRDKTSGLFKMYIDGKFESSMADTGLNLDTTPSVPVEIGKLATESYGGIYSGSIDDIRIYNHALSASDVAALYNSNGTSTSGVCGAANLTTVTIAPTNNLCTTGTASTKTGTGPWYWTCDGTNGGNPAICTAYLSSAPVDPTLTKSKLYMGTDDRFTASNSGISIYGGPGYDTVTISDGISGVTLDQNVERINFSGTASAYAFKQTGNKINIYNASGSTLIATAPVQGDSDGTVLGFSDGTTSALLSGGVMTLGGKTVSSTSAGVLTPTLTHVP